MYKGRYKVSDVCQLLDKSKYPATQTINGVTFTNNGDGTITVNSLEITANTYHQIAPYESLVKGHKYMVPMFGNYIGGYFYASVYDEDGKYITEISNSIYKATENSYHAIFILYATADHPVDDKLYKPQFFDLTEMYGAGNEPTNVAEFREKFPDELYPYSPYCWAKIKQTRYKVSNVCQLLDKSKYPATQTINGVTWTNNGDGTITANGTATANSTFNLIYKADLFTIIGHKYLLIGCPEGGNTLSTYFLRYDSDGGTVGYDVGNGVIFTKTAEKIAYVNIRVYAGYTANNLIFKPQLFDLTEMYGAGNEPTNVAEFREKFPDELYPYSPKCYLPLK